MEGDTAMRLNHDKHVKDQEIVAKALLNAAKRLEIKPAELSDIIGISQSRLSKIKNGTAEINSSLKEFELALFFIRLFRSLDAITGGDDSVSAYWIRNHNTAIKAVPLERIKKVDGLVNVLSYLDSRRARI